MATTICIIRHGETDWNVLKRFQGREDIDLNANGRKQAADIAGHLAEKSWDVIVSSPLKRAFSTAQIVAVRLEIESIAVNQHFIERDYGRAAGLTLEQRQQAFPDGCIPGKEDDESLRERVCRGLEELVEEYNGKKILLVAHGAVINSILKAVSKGEIDIGETNIKNACFNIIIYDGIDFNVVLFNSAELL